MGAEKKEKEKSQPVSGSDEIENSLTASVEKVKGALADTVRKHPYVSLALGFLGGIMIARWFTSGED